MLTALPHMLTHDDLAAAVKSIVNQIKNGGLFVASIRDYDALIMDTDPVPSPQPNLRVSCTGQLRRDLTKQFGVVDSPRTKAVYGRLRAGTASGLELEDKAGNYL